VGTTLSNIEEARQAAWPAIEKLIKGAIGEAKDRASRKVGVVQEVSDGTKTIPQTESSIENPTYQPGELLITKFSDRPIGLDHRRYVLRLNRDMLKGLKEESSANSLEPKDAIESWAKAALLHESQILLKRLVDWAQSSVEGDLNPASKDTPVTVIQRARREISKHCQGIGPATPLTLVLRAGPKADSERVRRALSGEIIDLPADQPVGEFDGVIFEPNAMKMKQVVALDLHFTYNLDGDEVKLLLDSRSLLWKEDPKPTPAMVKLKVAPDPVIPTPSLTLWF
jgi:hypothetical protein